MNVATTVHKAEMFSYLKGKPLQVFLLIYITPVAAVYMS